MPITITHVDQDSYTAHVTPPHGNGTEWRSQEPMTRPELYNELVRLGCHRIDIADALHEADRAWSNKSCATYYNPRVPVRGVMGTMVRSIFVIFRRPASLAQD